MTGIIGFVQRLRAQVEFSADGTPAGEALIVDLARKSNSAQVEQGPRFFIVRSMDNAGWKCVVHGDGESDPSHCIYINDTTQKVTVHEEGDAMWPD